MTDIGTELRWFGKVLPASLKEVRIVVLSDLHYGNPYCSTSHFLRAVEFVRANDDVYCFLNGDLCECVIKTSKGEIYNQVVSPKQQKKQLVKWLDPIKDKILGMTCLTDDTLVLSDRGWVTCYELTTKDRVLSLNLETNEAEYSVINGNFIKSWYGDIVELGGERQAQRLTADHWVLYWNDYKHTYEYRRAGTLPSDMHHIKIPIARQYKRGQEHSLSDDEVQFLAWVITEGHICTKRSLNPVIEITQSNGDSISELESLFARLSLNPSIHHHKGRKERVNESDWRVYYFPFEQVKSYIAILSGKKEIPRCLLELPYSQLKLFYDTLIKGDGNIERKEYYTANKVLALQVMELCLKLGYGARLTERKRNQLYTGYTDSVDTTGYVIKMYRYSDAYPKKKTTSRYQGNVFCLATSLGNFMAMRDGQPFFTGNTGNHERRIADIADDDPSEYIAEQLKVPYRPEGMLFKLSFGGGNSNHPEKPFVFWSYITHGYGGARTKSAKAVKAERAGTWIPQCDWVAMSHDHVVNVAPDVDFVPDNRGTIGADGFLSGKIIAHRKMLIKTNAFLKWGGYAESGGFPPSDLATPVILLLTPHSPLWSMSPEKPRKAVKVMV